MPTRNFQLGYVTETTYGTRAVPTAFIEPNDYALGVNIERIEARGLRAGTSVASSTRWSSGKQEVGGSFSMYVPYRDMGGLFKAVFGSSAISTPSGATNTRLHRYTIGSSLPSLTIQEGIPDTANTSRPWDFLGCMVNQMTISNSTDDLLTAEFEVMGQSYSSAQSLASASYGANDGLFSFTGATLTIGGSGITARDITFTLNNNLDRRFYLGAATTQQPLSTGLVEITGEINLDYVDNTQVTRFLNGTLAAITAVWQGDLIEGSFYNKVDVTFQNCRFDGDVPTVPGPELVNQPLRFKVLYDGSTGPVTFDYYTRDTTDK